jgi:molybdate transport system substrate-binding protein
MGRPIAAGLLLALSALSACGRDSGDRADLTVYAAASLRQPFTAIGDVFERSHPDTRVRFNFAGSSDLVAQLQQGGSADVLATADEITMRSARDLVQKPQVFAYNTMTVVVPADNPGRVQSLNDLADSDLYVVTCAPQVPCGAATARIQASSGIDISTDSEEASVTDVLNKVATGQADAGIVYTSDANSQRGAVRSLPVPPAVNTRNFYPIAITTETDVPDAGRDFIDLVTGPEGDRILRGAGFSGTVR